MQIIKDNKKKVTTLETIVHLVYNTNKLSEMVDYTFRVYLML